MSKYKAVYRIVLKTNVAGISNEIKSESAAIDQATKLARLYPNTQIEVQRKLENDSEEAWVVINTLEFSYKKEEPCQN